MNISSSALMQGSFASCQLDPRWPEARGPGCAGQDCYWYKRTGLLIYWDICLVPVARALRRGQTEAGGRVMRG